MTEYYRKLDVVAQSRYLENLKLLGLEEKDDPYEASIRVSHRCSVTVNNRTLTTGSRK